MTSLLFRHLSGAAIGEVLPELAELRIAVFREYPYLYAGSLDYEQAYLQTYVQSNRSLLFMVYDNGRLVGATTALPLRDETPDVQQPFLSAHYNLDTVFYFGESLLLPAYRGWGLGHRFFDEREAHASMFGQYKLTCFCAVDRPTDQPLRPAGYQPHDVFWIKRGYRRDANLRSLFWWPDLGEAESTPKSMVYWTRPLG